MKISYEQNPSVLKQLDIITSAVITRGGSVSGQNRQELDKISPFLFERMVGRAGYDLIVALKEVYDPNNVLNKDHMVHLTKYRQTGRL